MIVHPAISMSNEHRIACRRKGSMTAALEIIAERRSCDLPISYNRRLCARVAAVTIRIKSKDDMLIRLRHERCSAAPNKNIKMEIDLAHEECYKIITIRFCGGSFLVSGIGDPLIRVE
jgi:hypothetical protein